MQFAVQASVPGMRLVHSPVCALRHRAVATGASATHLGAFRVRSLGSSLASPFLAPGLAVLQLPAKELNGGRVRVGSARAEGKVGVGAYDKGAFSNESEANKIAQVAKRLERTAGHFKRLGSLGFWGQLVCTVVAAVILAFSVVITGQATSPVSIYLTAGGIAAAFLSVFWSFGYIRLAQKLRETVGNPSKAPPRAQVVKNLKNGIIINLLGMGATLLGLQATVGALVAKALTSNAAPYLQGAKSSYSPVLALDVFLVQASGNAIVAHFLGLVFSLELLRSVTLPPPSEQPKVSGSAMRIIEDDSTETVGTSLAERRKSQYGHQVAHLALFHPKLEILKHLQEAVVALKHLSSTFEMVTFTA